MCPFAEMWECWADTYTLVYRYRYVNSFAYFALDLLFVAKTLMVRSSDSKQQKCSSLYISTYLVIPTGTFQVFQAFVFHRSNLVFFQRFHSILIWWDPFRLLFFEICLRRKLLWNLVFVELSNVSFIKSFWVSEIKFTCFSQCQSQGNWVFVLSWNFC